MLDKIRSSCQDNFYFYLLFGYAKREPFSSANDSQQVGNATHYHLQTRSILMWDQAPARLA